MNNKLKEFLESLSLDEATEIWEWLDSTPDAVEQLIIVLVDSHPTEIEPNAEWKEECK